MSENVDGQQVKENKDCIENSDGQGNPIFKINKRESRVYTQQNKYAEEGPDVAEVQRSVYMIRIKFKAKTIFEKCKSARTSLNILHLFQKIKHVHTPIQ